MIKTVKSIDGFFKEKLNIVKLNYKKQQFDRYNTIVGEGNSISNLPYLSNTKAIKQKDSRNFLIDKKNLLLTVDGNSNLADIHNFLLKHKYYCHYFSSYPLVTVGGCIANGTHGIAPKLGIFNDFVKEIEIYNPNFGLKKLSNKQNKEIFELTKSGFGMTGIIVRAKLKIFKLPSTNIKIENFEFNDLLNCYKFMKQSKQIYNQNSFTVNYSKKKIFFGRLIMGSFGKKEFVIKKIKNKKIPSLRFGIFKYFFLKNLIFNLIFLLERLKIFLKKERHINDILFTSNKRTAYFLLMPDKFIEYQNIIPEKKVKNYLVDFENVILKYRPNISLLHLKQFLNHSKNFEFNGKGLAIAIHIIKDKNFKIFVKKLIELDFKYKCKLNLYKNGLIYSNIAKKFNKNNYQKFLDKIKKINKNYKFTNNIFKRNI